MPSLRLQPLVLLCLLLALVGMAPLRHCQHGAYEKADSAPGWSLATGAVDEDGGDCSCPCHQVLVAEELCLGGLSVPRPGVTVRYPLGAERVPEARLQGIEHPPQLG